MAIRDATTKAIDELATAITSSDVSTVHEIYDRFWFLIDAALAALMRDPIASNRSFREVESELWALLVHLAENRDKYSAAKQLRARVQEFGSVLARATDTYEMAIGIDHLTVPDSTNIRVASCVLVHFDRSRPDE